MEEKELAALKNAVAALGETVIALSEDLKRQHMLNSVYGAALLAIASTHPRAGQARESFLRSLRDIEKEHPTLAAGGAVFLPEVKAFLAALQRDHEPG